MKWWSISIVFRALQKLINVFFWELFKTYMTYAKQRCKKTISCHGYTALLATVENNKRHNQNHGSRKNKYFSLISRRIIMENHCLRLLMKSSNEITIHEKKQAISRIWREYPTLSLIEDEMDIILISSHQRFEKILDNKWPSQNANENEYATSFVWFWENTPDFVVTFHMWAQLGYPGSGFCPFRFDFRARESIHLSMKVLFDFICYLMPKV